VVLRIDLARDDPCLREREGVSFELWSRAEIETWRRRGGDLPLQVFRDRIDRVEACMVAVIERELAAFVWIYRRGDPNRFLRLAEGEAEVNHGYVFPRYRGRRLYGALLAQACGRLKVQGYRRAYGVVPVANRAALRACREAGLQEIGQVRQWGLVRPRFREAVATPPERAPSAMRPGGRPWGR
jgi:ribosomal protein S18 acetylase RimI-like enzyme